MIGLARVRFTWQAEGTTAEYDIEQLCTFIATLQLTTAMPCEGCAAYAWCRGNCMKNLYNDYVKQDVPSRTEVVDPICRLIPFTGRKIDQRNPHAWFDRAARPVALRSRLTG